MAGISERCQLKGKKKMIIGFFVLFIGMFSLTCGDFVACVHGGDRRQKQVDKYSMCHFAVVCSWKSCVNYNTL